MKDANLKRRGGLFGLKSLLVLGCVAATLGGYSQLAAAVAPPANTIISNQATASYKDNAGVQQVATSNTVQTTIQQVGSFTLTPPTPGTGTPLAGWTKAGAAGSTVVMPYTLTNTGNGADNFTITVTETGATNDFANINVYADVNQDGVADSTTPLVGPLTGNGATGTTAAIAIPAGSSYSFVVTYGIPATATGVWSNTANVTATAGTPLLYTTSALVRNDVVNLTTVAAFSANKSIGAPAVAAPAGAPLLGAWGAAPNSGPVLTKTVYTINYVNNGAQAGNIYIKDILPAGLTYQTGTAVWSSAPGTALSEAGADPAGIDFAQAGQTIEAVVANVGPGQTGTLSFQVQVAAGATVGTATTTNTASYTEATCNVTATIAACSAAPQVNTGAAPFTVLATYDGVMTATGTVGTGQDTPTNGTPNAPGVDQRTVASMVPGGSTQFAFTVFNNGNATDTFKLSTGTSTFPAGTLFSWFAADGVTPLQNTAGGVGVDTGPIAAGGSVVVKLQAYLPLSAPAGVGLNHSVITLATSVGAPTELDAAKAVVTDVLTGVVDLLNSLAGTPGSDIGPGTATVVNSIGVTAGGAGNNSTMTAGSGAVPGPEGSAVFMLVVKNNDTGALTFNLSASSTSVFPGNLPAGWTVGFYSDAAATLAITNTGAIAAGGSATVYAKVTPPVSTAAGTFDVYFQAESTTNAAMTGAIARDYKRDQVVVAADGSYSMNLSAANALQVSPGNSATFAHTLTNTGVNACGQGGTALNIAVTGLPAGWTSAIYLDNGSTIGVIDGTDTLVTTGTIPSVAAAGTSNLLVRLFAPSGAAAGDVASATVTVSDALAPAGCGTVSVVDTATVVTSGQMQVVKTQSIDVLCDGTADNALAGTPISGAKPGECIQYQVVATNAGTSNVQNVSLNDVVPSFTTWHATQPAVACETTAADVVALVRTPVAGTAAGTTMTCGTVVNLIPGGTITLRYAVQIDQ